MLSVNIKCLSFKCIFLLTSLLPAISRGIQRRFQINFEFCEPLSFLVRRLGKHLLCFHNIVEDLEDKRRCQKKTRKKRESHFTEEVCLQWCFKKRYLTTLSVRSIASRYRYSKLYFSLHIKQCNSLGNTCLPRGAYILFEAEAE